MAAHLSILVIHNMENVARARESTADYVFCFERHAPEHTYIYHKITLPFPDAVTEGDFDVVIFDSTALGVVTFRPRSKYDAIKQALGFLRDHPAVKIFMPQDDYNHSALLDDLFMLLKADVVYTPLPEHVEVLYPRSFHRVRFREALTGYIEDSRVESRSRLAKPFEQRSRLIGQRVTLYPPRGGRFSRIKGEVAEAVKARCLEKGLAIDISTDPADVFLGEEWFAFLGDCQFVLGSESGVSLHDPYGDIADDIEEFEKSNREASFDVIEAACFPGLDGQRIFSALSPRVFEAALMGACQILTEGDYNGVLVPNVDYIPLKLDLSNLDEVIELTRDAERAKQIAGSAYRRLIERLDYRFSNFVSQFFNLVQTIRAERTGGARVPGSGPITAEVRLRQMRGIRRQLTIDAVQTEGFYEPYLSPWVADRISGQLGLDVSPEDLKLPAAGSGEADQVPEEFRRETAAIIARGAAAILLTLRGRPVSRNDAPEHDDLVDRVGAALEALISPSAPQQHVETVADIMSGIGGRHDRIALAKRLLLGTLFEAQQDVDSIAVRTEKARAQLAGANGTRQRALDLPEAKVRLFEDVLAALGDSADDVAIQEVRDVLMAVRHSWLRGALIRRLARLNRPG